MNLKNNMWKNGIRIAMISICFTFTVDCQCNLPLSNGTWFTSARGTWIVNANSQVIENVESSLSATQPTSNLTCEMQTGTHYILSTSVEVFTGIYITSYTCIDIRTTSNSPEKYIFYFVTATDPSHGDHFTTNLTIACSNTGYETPSNTHIILKDGSVNNVKSTLPDVIRGNYTLNYTDTDGVTVSGSTMNSCSDVTVMAFNQSDNSRKLGFSETGDLLCVYTFSVGDLYYAITYNNDSTVDSSSTYRFACWVFSYSSPGVVATVVPRICQANQNSTTAPSGGQTFSFIASEVCPGGSETDDGDEGLSTSLIIAIVITSCVLVGIVIVVVICILKHKSKTKREEDEQPLKKVTSDKFTTVTETRDSNNKQDSGTQTTPTDYENNKDRPMTRWSKARHRRTFGHQKSIPDSKTDSSLISGYADTDITIRRAYVSMAPTSLLFTGINSRAKSKEGNLNNYPEMLNQRSKSMVDTRKRKRVVPYKERKNKVESSENTRKRLETLQMIRTKTFHEFAREFDKLKPFPTDNKENNEINSQCIGKEKDSTENTNKQSDDRDSNETHTRPSTLKSRPSTTGHLVSREGQPKSPAKRTRSETAALSKTALGFSYNSPYALTSQQKQYFAERTSWIQQMKQRDILEENILTEKRNQENNLAYKAWLKNKAAGSQKLKHFYLNNYKKKRKLRVQISEDSKEVTDVRNETTTIDSNKNDQQTND